MNRLQSKLEKMGRDPIVTAKAVSLRYCVNYSKGYFRIKKKSTYHYIDQNKNSIIDPEILARISKLVLPPAWENVWISPYENGHLQATGVDSKGRKQYRYHEQWNKIRNQSKFYRIQSFALALPLIRKRVEQDLKNRNLTYEKVIALVIKLIEITNIRIGNEAYKKLYGSFGLTTLQDRHVGFQNSKIRFEFIGKKGVKHKISFISKKLAAVVKRCKDIPGQDLFQYFDLQGNHHTIGSADINNYLKNITNQDFTAKDFRVWSGSVNALSAFQKLKPSVNQTECKHKIIEVIDEVALKLGNTRSVCKKYYVHPTIVAAFEKGSIWQYKSKKINAQFLPEEYALLKLLDKEIIANI